MLKNKTFLLHLEMNKLLNHFTGTIKDIDEVINADKVVNITMKSMEFEGKIKDKRIHHLSQNLKYLHLKIAKNFDMNMSNLENTYTLTGSGTKNYQTEYKLENLAVKSDNKDLSIDEISILSYAKLENILSGFAIEIHSKEIAYGDSRQKTQLNTIDFEMKADNFDMATLRKLETINPNDEKEVFESLQKLISHGITLTVPNFSIQSIMLNKQKLDGFKISSHFDIDKSLNIARLSQNPMSAISAMNASLYLSMSNDIFAMVAVQPQAMMAMMLVQPKDVNGSKVYDVKLKDSKLTVNGKPLM
jgi:hypothetical protein